MEAKIVRNFDRKNRLSAKRSGRVRTQEKYIRTNETFFWNNTFKSTEQCDLNNVLLMSSNVNVLTSQALQILCNQFELTEKSSASSCSLLGHGTVWLVFQSTLSEFLNTASFQLRQIFKELLVGKYSSRMRIVLFYDELVGPFPGFYINSDSNNPCPCPDGSRLDLSAVVFMKQHLEKTFNQKFSLTIVCNPTTARHDDIFLKTHEISVIAIQTILQVSNIEDIYNGTATAGLTVGLKNMYRPHIALSSDRGYVAGDNQTKFYKGKLMVYRHSPFEAEVETLSASGSDSAVKTVLIRGRLDMNRAFDGDTVLVCLYPREQWVGQLSRDSLLTPPTPSDASLVATDDDQDIGILGDGGAMETPVLGQTSNAAQDSGGMPTGYVISVIQRQQLEFLAYIPQIKQTERGSNSIGAGSAVLSYDESILAIPCDQRYPKFRLRTKQKHVLQGKKVQIIFDEWLSNSLYPSGHLSRILGCSDDPETEVRALMMSCNVSPQPFSIHALACLPTIPEQSSPSDSSDASGSGALSAKKTNTSSGTQWKDSHWQIPPALLSNRRDLRVHIGSEKKEMTASKATLLSDHHAQSLRIFSVDPHGCQDIDDTMGVRWLNGLVPGLVEVIVCIADVCAFLPQSCALDVEAQYKGTTVYLPHRRYDMLPSLLSSDLASLHGNKDRLAVGTSWLLRVTHSDGTAVKPGEDLLQLDKQNNIHFSFISATSSGSGGEEKGVLAWAGRCVVRSVAAMTYEQAHNLIQNSPPDPHSEFICQHHLKSKSQATNSVDVSNAYENTALPESILEVPAGQAGRPIAADLWPLLQSDLKFLTVFSRFLKRRRAETGSLEIHQSKGSELKFKFDPEGAMYEMNGKEELEIHETIAELMILSNSSVAEILTIATPLEAMLRIHPPPTLEKSDDVHKFIADVTAVADDTDTCRVSADSKELKSSLHSFRGLLSKKIHSQQLAGNNVSNAVDLERMVSDLVNSAVVKAMNEARYVSSGSLSGSLTPSVTGAAAAADDGTAAEGRLRGHYGLGVSHYTHFTSPIRRYADIVVHRQLLALIDSVHSLSDRHCSSDTTVDWLDFSKLKKSDDKDTLLAESLFRDFVGVSAESVQLFVNFIHSYRSPTYRFGHHDSDVTVAMPDSCLPSALELVSAPLVHSAVTAIVTESMASFPPLSSTQAQAFIGQSRRQHLWMSSMTF